MKRLVDQSFADQTFASLQSFVSLKSLMAAIGRSPIRVSQPPAPLPGGFEEIDVAVLAWIAGEARHLRRHTTLM